MDAIRAAGQGSNAPAPNACGHPFRFQNDANVRSRIRPGQKKVGSEGRLERDVRGSVHRSRADGKSRCPTAFQPDARKANAAFRYILPSMTRPCITGSPADARSMP